jgi:hypothetical protein
MSAVLYHFADPANRESILSNGLLRSKSQAFEGAIFFTDTVNPKEAGSSDVWEVNVDGLELEPDWTTEPFDNEAWFVAFEQDIEPARLTLLKRGNE